jgi:RNA polymerase sigma-70 factor (ECF subfamily)
VPQNGNGLQEAGAPELERASELFARHSAGVYRYCLRRLGSREEAEDALQVTYLNAWRSLKGGFQPDEHRPWLYQIAANVCSTSLRSKLGRKQVELRDPAALDSLVAQDRAAGDELVGLSEALRDLPTRQRRALVLRDWQGLSYNEIAAELAVSVASVETLLFRGRNKIAATLSNADWRKAAPSARALLIWPFAFLRTKPAATAGAEHLKMGLVLAGGAVAPLVTFGLIQGFLPGQSNQPPQSVLTSPIVQVKSAQASGPSVDESSLARVPDLRARTDEAGAPRHSGAGKHAVSPKGGSQSHPSAAPPTKSGPPDAPAAKSNKVVLCHETHSPKNPGVTISVSGHGTNGHREDSPGAC